MKEAQERASNIILDLTNLANPIFPEEEAGGGEAKHKAKGEGDGDFPRFKPMTPDPGMITKDIRPWEFRAWIKKFKAFIVISTRGIPSHEIYVKTFVSKCDSW